MFTKKNILKKTIEVGSSTLLSRFLGVVREVLTVQYLGVSALSDAFLTAYKIPNSLRKIFAEGALSAAFIPTIVQTMRSDGQRAVNSIMTLGFLVFEGLVLIICALAMIYARAVILFCAPGFSDEQLHMAVMCLQIVMPFIFFVSSSALLAGALQSVGHFFVPAFSSVLLNVVYIIGLMVCLYWRLSVSYLCFFILLGGLLQFLAHLFTYYKRAFGFNTIRKQDWVHFGSAFFKFVSCLMSMSVMEMGLIIDGRFASYLSKGSVSIMYYANRFMGIPLGVFAVAFSTILLPHFARVGTYAPRRLGFYLLESAKFIWWVTLPVTLLMCFLSHKIFSTIFLSDKFTLVQVDEASMVLQAFVIGLFFFSLNKILLSLYYALHITATPALIAAATAFLNIALNSLLMPWFKATGIAAATTLAVMVQTMISVSVIAYAVQMPVYMQHFLRFAVQYTMQVLLTAIPFVLLYYGIIALSTFVFSAYIAHIMLDTIVFWGWVTPLIMLFGYCIYRMRHYFSLTLFFFD